MTFSDDPPITDFALLRASDTNPAAFRALYDRHAARVNAFFRRRTRDPDVALELTAETFAQAWLARHKCAELDGGLGGWLFGIARNVLLRSLREQAVERRGRDRLGIRVEPSAVDLPSDWLDGLDADLTAALEELPEGQRRAVELRVLGDRAYAEAADLLGTSPAAVRVRVHRGLAAMRRRLAARAAN